MTSCTQQPKCPPSNTLYLVAFSHHAILVCFCSNSCFGCLILTILFWLLTNSSIFCSHVVTSPVYFGYLGHPHGNLIHSTHLAQPGISQTHPISSLVLDSKKPQSSSYRHHKVRACLLAFPSLPPCLAHDRCSTNMF